MIWNKASLHLYLSCHPAPYLPDIQRSPSDVLFSALLGIYLFLYCKSEGEKSLLLLFLGSRYSLCNKHSGLWKEGIFIYSFNVCVPACLHVHPMHAGCQGQGRALILWSGVKRWCEPPGTRVLSKNSHASSLDAQALTRALPFTSVVHGILSQGYLFLHLKVAVKE